MSEEGLVLESIEGRFRGLTPGVEFCSLRVLRERAERLTVRQDVVEPPSVSDDLGAMVTVIHEGGLGYAATSDLSTEGLAEALRRAKGWAARTAGRAVMDFSSLTHAHPQGEYRGPEQRSYAEVGLEEKLEVLRRECAAMATSERVVDRTAMLWRTDVESLYLTSGGGRVHQAYGVLIPGLAAVANQGAETQQRTLGGMNCGWQGGWEVLDTAGFHGAGARVAEEAVTLLEAPECPSGAMDLVLAPDQMILQIHESIGHPIELDRILGDERNYAGTSFVTLDMFGSYQYGSELLNVSFDPTVPDQIASYAFDDEGAQAEKVMVIERGVLKRPLGGAVSQARAGIAGVANSRADSWRRPPIDRMANLNVEAGETPLDQLIGGVERGVYMETNCSWSIDDSRNKFQFGCELGRVIEDGQLKGVVKNPNYRGISATFWRNLSAVGTSETVRVLGTPYCGKGEPNQVIRVGHASPTCRFSNVDVFGGDA